MATSKLLFTALAAILAAKTAGNGPVLTVETNADIGFEAFNRKVTVFDISIYAAPGVVDEKLLHAANILAQYLDNNEDGTADNQLVVQEMKRNHSFMVMWKNESDLDAFIPPADSIGQDLGSDETIPEWHNNGHTGRFDAAVEEVWHLVSHAGYAEAYPAIFGENLSTQLTGAMDWARGGMFIDVPDQYPEEAWFTYYDETCDYECMAAEYFYWALSSLLGAQVNRFDEIGDEWQLYTPMLVENRDRAAYNILTDSRYKLPTVLPDGTYRK